MFNKKYIFPTVLLCFLSIINAGLCFLPLLNVIGYEISAINSVLIFILSGSSVIHFYKSDIWLELSFYKIIRNEYRFFGLLVLLPFVISIFNTIIFEKCPVGDGIYFYLILVLPAFIMGSVCGFFALTLNKKFAQLFLLVLVLLLTVKTGLEFYFYHQVYFYSPLFGFFPGVIYDEIIIIQGKLILYQMGNIFIAAVFLYFIEKKTSGTFKTKILLGFSVLIISVIFFLIKPFIGFAENGITLQNQTGSKYETEHFIIFYPQFVSDNRIRTIALEHEFYYKMLSQKFGYNTSDKINSYIFSDAGQKGRTLGAENADVAKIWLNSVYLDINSYSSTLKHELVHIFTSKIGITPFRISGGLNMALLEGTAVAIENNFDNMNLHYAAQKAIQNYPDLRVSDIFSGLNFFAGNTRISYLISGSFIKYLIESYGMNKFKKFYSTFDSETVYGHKFGKLFNDYQVFLTKNFKIEDQKHLKEYFVDKPLIKKYCARYVAKNIKYASDLFEQGLFKDALFTYTKIYELTQNFNALAGIFRINDKLKYYDQNISMLSSENAEFRNTLYEVYLKYYLSETYIKTNDLQKSNYLLNWIIERGEIRNLSDAVKIRLLLSENSDSVLIKYVSGSPFDKTIILNDLLKNNRQPFLINLYLDLAVQLDINPKMVIENLKKKEVENTGDISSVYSRISEYALNNILINEAVYFARKALDYSQSFNEEVIKENLEKLMWIKKSGKF